MSSVYSPWAIHQDPRCKPLLLTVMTLSVPGRYPRTSGQSWWQQPCRHCSDGGTFVIFSLSHTERVDPVSQMTLLIVYGFSLSVPWALREEEKEALFYCPSQGVRVDSSAPREIHPCHLSLQGRMDWKGRMLCWSKGIVFGTSFCGYLIL